MHIVFGGAFNGKRQYVKNLLKGQKVDWFEGELPEKEGGAAMAVIAGVDVWIKRQLENRMAEEQILEKIKQVLPQQESSRIIWILTDMNRGIVPIDPLEREMRDAVGRIYQFLFAQAEEITRLWYGIPQNIKGGDGR